VVIAGGGPTGLMLAGELALAGVDVAIVERRAGQELAGSRAGGLQSLTIEVLDQRGIADRFISQGTVAQVAAYLHGIPLDISDFPTRHNYGLGLWQNHIERILAGWVHELRVPIYRGREVTGIAQGDTGVDACQPQHGRRPGEPGTDPVDGPVAGPHGELVALAEPAPYRLAQLPLQVAAHVGEGRGAGPRRTSRRDAWARRTGSVRLCPPYRTTPPRPTCRSPH